ncbi:MAG: L,D-transpeptidase [Flavobacteriales bacterium]|jgi:lipoprotein-anchoring transpeptidase ErfK/SrfK|nr:L,D-transpeptidase [Flavobacteriales bacterium]MBT5090725.1 L,D-transpeptidase [Flavobacteriales bacterium]MBT5750915.1 L,D-transpeptidase [Flavobacteriales bacterium]
MFRIIILILISLISLNTIAQNSIIEYVNNYLDIKDTFRDEILYVSIKEQKLYHIQNDSIVKEYIISSSAYGIGSKSGSNKTPIGLHKIAKKYGEKTPVNGRMIGRVFYGDIATIYTDDTKSKTDDVTSRILWLEGMEKEKNKGKGIDSFNRYIYIHGTSEEGMLGKPASHGCIRMKNKEVIDLYKLVEVGTLVLIL